MIVRMPEPEYLKVEDLSKSVKRAPHSEQATGHGMHCREILFTTHSPRASRQRVSRVVSTFLYVCGATGRRLPNFRILAYFPHIKPIKRQNSIDALSRSRCRERRLNKAKCRTKATPSSNLSTSKRTRKL